MMKCLEINILLDTDTIAIYWKTISNAPIWYRYWYYRYRQYIVIF